MRKLHTIKGSARMAGAMRLGEAVHHMETRMEAAMQLRRRAADHHRRPAYAVRPRDGAVRRVADPSAPATAANAAASDRRRRSLRGRRSSISRQHAAMRRATPAEDGLRWLPRSGRTRRRSQRHDDGGCTWHSSRRRRSCACAPTCSTSWSIRPARYRSRARSLRTRSARSRVGDRPDGEHFAAAGAAARSRDSGRCADPGARRQAVARIRGVRSTRVRPLYAPAGTDAHAGRVGRRRGDGPEQHAEGAAECRHRSDLAIAPDA